MSMNVLYTDNFYTVVFGDSGNYGPEFTITD